MNYRTDPEFWTKFSRLPPDVQALARRNYALLQTDAAHPSLHFKRVGPFWTVRVGIHYRAIGTAEEDGVIWFWIGSHAEYDRLLKNV